VAVFFAVLGHLTGPTRDRCAIGDRRNARSANLRATGALGAAKRLPQFVQESRSEPARCDGMGRDRNSPTEIARSIAKPLIAARTVTAPRTPSIACIAERDRGAAMCSARRRALRPSPMNRKGNKITEQCGWEQTGVAFAHE
jgi:hypothetical protein